MKKIINFYPRSYEVSSLLDAPIVAKKIVPEWYKNLGSSYVGESGFNLPGPQKCLPFLDPFISGYIHELACDVEVINSGWNEEKQQENITYKWASSHLTKIRPLMTRQEASGAPHVFPEFPGYYNVEFQWYTMWDPQTPPGYSTIYTHPFNRFDLPFQTMTGIIDTDKWHGAGPVPFLLKKGFQGLIPEGTPIIQFFPFKREDWESKKIEYDYERDIKKEYSLKKFLQNGYRKDFWSKKNYS